MQNLLFTWRRIIGWMLNGICSGIIIFFLCTSALEPQAYNNEGKTAGRDILGPTMYTCVVWVVNCQMALSISYFTIFHHIAVWGEIGLWYVFLLVYGSMPSSFTTTAYKIFVETLAPYPFYWLITVCVVIAALIPYVLYKSIQMKFFPTYHGMIQWIRHEGHADDSEYINLVKQRSTNRATVGFTARTLARTNPLTGSIHRKR